MIIVHNDCRPRAHAVNMRGERVELEEEPSRQKRRFEPRNAARDYLAGLRRKEALLRQDRQDKYVYYMCVYVCVCVHV